jgi:hypothetical protein
MSAVNRIALPHAAALTLFVVLAVGMTWPLAPNIDRAVAHEGDPYINTWILDWNWYAAFHRPLSLFDANTFYPARYSLAYSENLFGIALLLFPFRAAGASPITAHNLAILGGFAFSGFTMYLLGRFLTGNALAGVVAGVFYAFVPFRFTHLSHVQHVWGFTLPMMLVALLDYARRPTWPRAALFAAAYLLNGLSNIHWLLFGTIAIAITALILRPRLVPLAACTAAALLLLVPFLYPYVVVAKMYGMERSWQETKEHSAQPLDWFVSNLHNRMYIALRNPKIDPERRLFPGALSLGIGGVALFSRKRRALLVALAWIVLGFLGSLGLHMFFHRFLFDYVPGFRAIRVPARWAAVAYVGLAMLIAIATASLASKRKWMSVLLAAAFAIELRAAPIRWYLAPTEIPPVYRWIGVTKPRAIADLPIGPGFQYLTLLRATAHHRPMVNGIYGPPHYLGIARLAEEWSDALIPELRRIGVSHIVVHADWIEDNGRAWLRRALAGREIGFVGRFDSGVFGDWVFAIGGPFRPSEELEAMLRGEPTYSETTLGVLHTPVNGERLTDRALVSGFAFSPYGVREVNLLLNNGTIRLPTIRRADPALQKRFPWYDATTEPRFLAAFSKRPQRVWANTDIQVEIIDGRGRRTLLDDRWITWP